MIINLFIILITNFKIPTISTKSKDCFNASFYYFSASHKHKEDLNQKNK